MAKVRTNVKPIHRKPTVHVPLTGGYTPAEEKVMQERKIALIEQHNAQLEAIKNHTDKTVTHLLNVEARLGNLQTEVAAVALAITALSNVLQVLVTQAVPAKRGRPAKVEPVSGAGVPSLEAARAAAKEGTQEPRGATPAELAAAEPLTLHAEAHRPAAEVEVHAAAKAVTAAKDFVAQQAKLPVKEGLVHESITAEQKALAQAKAPPTLDELRTTFLDFIAKNGREAGIGKLKSFGIAKLGELPANEYAAFKSTLA